MAFFIVLRTGNDRHYGYSSKNCQYYSTKNKEVPSRPILRPCQVVSPDFFFFNFSSSFLLLPPASFSFLLLLPPSFSFLLLPPPSFSFLPLPPPSSPFLLLPSPSSSFFLPFPPPSSSAGSFVRSCSFAKSVQCVLVCLSGWALVGGWWLVEAKKKGNKKKERVS